MSVDRTPPPPRRDLPPRPMDDLLDSSVMGDRLVSPARPLNIHGYADPVRDEVAPPVDAVHACKIPPFWKANPELWFLQVEAQFQLHRVRSDDSMYNTVLSMLDADALQEVADIVRAPPVGRKYDGLKTALLQRLTDSSDRQLHKMLTQLELGDKKPTQLLRHMRTLAGDRASEDILRIKFLDLLPMSTQRLLKILKSASLEETAAAADELLEAAPTVAAVSRFDSQFRPISPADSGRASPRLDGVLTRLAEEVASMKFAVGQLSGVCREIMDRLDKPNFRSDRRPQSRSRQRSPSPSSTLSGLCIYHRRYGDNARRCVLPCSRGTLLLPSPSSENQ